MTLASEKSDFRLATLLRLRESTRDECRALLAEVHRADEELVRQLARLGTEQERLQNECREAASPGTLDVDRLVKANRYGAWLQARDKDLRERRQLLAVEIDRRRDLLLKADQDVQVLEKLRERRRQSQRLGDERQASKQLDEVALLAAASLGTGTLNMPAALRSA